MIERIVYDADENEIRKSWGLDWSRMMKDFKKYGYCQILIGKWSGYSDQQKSIQHVEYVPWGSTDEMRLQSITFSDQTILTIDVQKVALEFILGAKIRRMPHYGILIQNARASMQSVYEVGSWELVNGTDEPISIIEPISLPNEPNMEGISVTTNNPWWHN